jgi:hypothetical protein
MSSAPSQGVIPEHWPRRAFGYRGPPRPLIQGVPLSRLQRATGLSLRYVSLIRRGERTPHPRHWQAFVDLADGWLPS